MNWGGYYYQAISAYAPHPAAARLWEEYLYSDEGQLTWIKGYCAPARLADMFARNVVSDELQGQTARSQTAGVTPIVPSGDQLSGGPRA